MAYIISRLADLPPGKQRLRALKLKQKADAVAASGAARPPAPEAILLELGKMGDNEAESVWRGWAASSIRSPKA